LVRPQARGRKRWPGVAKISATQLTAITTEQLFDQTPMLNPRESVHCHIQGRLPRSPTDDAVISVYGSLEGTAWSATPLMVLVLDKDVDPNSIDCLVTGSTSSASA
jgi:hypothetical protein